MNNYNLLGFAIEKRHGCYTIGNLNDGDISGVKTQDARNNSLDYWIVEYCDTNLHAYFSSQQHICQGTCTDFINASTNATSFEWSFPGAIPDTSTAFSPTGICFANTGTYSVRLVAINGNGSDTLFFQVTVHPPAQPSTITIETCDRYSIPGGHYTWTNSGIYNDTIVNPTGCDSIITINLTILNSNVSVIDTFACNYISPGGHSWITSGTYIDTIPNFIGCDSVITVHLNSNSSSSYSVSSCLSYISPSGNYIWTASGIYVDTIPSANGCDSFLTINATIHQIDTTVSFNFPILTAHATGMYQWINCMNGAFIAGANNQSFTPVADGSYAVIIIQNGCVDTSSCFMVIITGNPNDWMSMNMQVVQNPATEKLLIRGFSDADQLIDVTIYNVIGEKMSIDIQSVAKNNSSFEIDVHALPAGLYYVEISFSEKTFRSKFVKAAGR